MPIRLPATITVDFSNSEDDGLIFVRSARATRPLDVGETVLATDGEEHVCDARVGWIEGKLVYLRLDCDTWTTVEFTQSTAGAVAAQRLVPSFVANGGASMQSDSPPVDISP